MLLAGAVVLALLVPSQQKAIAKGVFFDPDSPAGKEYALPLDQARDEAAGVGKSDGPAGEKAPLFGEGLSSGGTGQGPGASGEPRKVRKAAADREEDTGATSAPGKPIADIASADSSYALTSAVLWVAVIVTLGGLVGLVLRGLQRPRPT